MHYEHSLGSTVSKSGFSGWDCEMGRSLAEENESRQEMKAVSLQPCPKALGVPSGAQRRLGLLVRAWSCCECGEGTRGLLGQ